MSAILAFIFTVLSGVMIYVMGQIILKLMIEPVHEAKKTIAEISHSLVEYADIIHNPGVLAQEKTIEVSQHLRRLSAQLHAHLFLIPCYRKTAWVFGLPSRDKILTAATQLRGLSNVIFSTRENIHEEIAKRCEAICDALGIYFAADERWPKE